MHAREMPRLRHVFLDNLFGNINHRERHEMLEGVRANGGGRCTANVMLPVLYPRFRRRTRHRRPADRRLVDSRENDAFHSPCFVLGLFYIRDVEQLKSCLSFSISLSLARALRYRIFCLEIDCLTAFEYF